MQTLQLLGGADGHFAFMRRARAHLRDGGIVAVAIADVRPTLKEFEWHDGDASPLPDVTEQDGWAYFSQPDRRQAQETRSSSSAGAKPSTRHGARSTSADRIALDVVSVQGLQEAGQRAGLLTPTRCARSRPPRKHIGSQVVIFRCLRPRTLHVCALYPDLMNIYADRGNLLMLRRRCELARARLRACWSRYRRRARPDGCGPSITWAVARIATRSSAPRIARATSRAALDPAAAERGAVVLGVCGGYQLLGHAYQLGDAELPGVGLLDISTTRGEGPAADRQRRDRGRPAGAEGRVLRRL